MEADGDGLMEDDLQALLPNCRQLSRDELSQVSDLNFHITIAEIENEKKNNQITRDPLPYPNNILASQVVANFVLHKFLFNLL